MPGTYGDHSEMLTYNGPRTDVDDITTYAYYDDKYNNDPWTNGAQFYTITNVKDQEHSYIMFRFYSFLTDDRNSFWKVLRGLLL